MKDSVHLKVGIQEGFKFAIGFMMAHLAVAMVVVALSVGTLVIIGKTNAEQISNFLTTIEK